MCVSSFYIFFFGQFCTGPRDQNRMPVRDRDFSRRLIGKFSVKGFSIGGPLCNIARWTWEAVYAVQLSLQRQGGKSSRGKHKIAWQLREPPFSGTRLCAFSLSFSLLSRHVVYNNRPSLSPCLYRAAHRRERERENLNFIHAARFVDYPKRERIKNDARERESGRL